MEGVRDQFPVEIFSFLMEFFLEVILRTFQSDSRRDLSRERDESLSKLDILSD